MTTRQRPDRTRTGRIYDVEIGGSPVQLTITELPDGRPGEVFLNGGKQGSTLAGMCDAVSILASLALQHHAPVTDVVKRLANHRFEPAGITNDPDIPRATSLTDYVARRLAYDYLSPEQLVELGLIGR